MSLSDQDVQEIVAMLDELDATELRLRTRHYSLWLRRDGRDGGWRQAGEVPPPARTTGATAGAPPAPPVDGGDPAPPVAGEPAAGPPERLVAVRTPLMGTFYRAPKPGAAPFVEVGDAVHEDTVVGIVETMKLMNSVRAGARGTVAEICLADAAPADRGAVLMRIAQERPE